MRDTQPINIYFANVVQYTVQYITTQYRTVQISIVQHRRRNFSISQPIMLVAGANFACTVF